MINWEERRGRKKGRTKGDGKSRIINWEGTQGETFHLDPEGSLGVYLAMKDGREERKNEGMRSAWKGNSLHSRREVCVCMCVYMCTCQGMKWLQDGQWQIGLKQI